MMLEGYYIYHYVRLRPWRKKVKKVVKISNKMRNMVGD